LIAAFNAILVFAVAGYSVIEGIGRFFAPQPVESVGMLIVATRGCS
jgi:cobalt-zinc-cadmium efflux system protein